MPDYYMPAEWAPHHGTLLSWPRNTDTWLGDKLQKAEKVFVEIVHALHPHEKVYICAGGIERRVEKTLVEHDLLSNIRILPYRTNDNWMRDHGPIFVVDKQTGDAAITNWGYNAWGGKYPPYDDDNRIPKHIAAHFGLAVINTGIILEGGSIEVDGKGRLITTRSCLLNPNRNPQLNQQQIEDKLKEHLGITETLWLEEGIAGDDTDGHIDDLTRILPNGNILTIVEQDPTDENHSILQKNLEDLKKLQQNEVISLPMPPPLVVDGERLPVSYANYYVANEVVLLPVFGAVTDQQAIDILAEGFADRKVIPIHCADLLWGLGGIHCVTQQIPAAPNIRLI